MPMSLPVPVGSPGPPEAPDAPEAPGRGGAHHFPPVLQFLTRVLPADRAQLEAAAYGAFQRGSGIDACCQAVHDAALQLGYDVAMGVQEVSSDQMPSFPGQRVLSAIVLVDAQRRKPRDAESFA